MKHADNNRRMKQKDTICLLLFCLLLFVSYSISGSALKKSDTQKISAIEAYSMLIEENPCDYNALYMRGIEYANGNLWNEAISDFLLALDYIDKKIELPYRIYDDNDILTCNVLLELGNAYCTIKDYTNSIVYMQRLMDNKTLFEKCIISQQMYTRATLAYNYWNLGNIEKALLLYQANILEDDVAGNLSAETTEYFNLSVTNAQYLLFLLDNPAEGYLLVSADLKEIEDNCSKGTLLPFSKPSTKREQYLQGALYLSTGLYAKANDTFTLIINKIENDTTSDESKALLVACLTAKGKAVYMQQESDASTALSCFNQAQPYIDDKRYDFLVDYYYWKGIILLAMGDEESSLKCVRAIAENPNIGLLEDDISIFYVASANGILDGLSQQDEQRNNIRLTQ